MSPRMSVYILCSHVGIFVGRMPRSAITVGACTTLELLNNFVLEDTWPLISQKSNYSHKPLLPVCLRSYTTWYRMTINRRSLSLTVCALCSPSREATERRSWPRVWPISECSPAATSPFLEVPVCPSVPLSGIFCPFHTPLLPESHTTA